MKIMGILCSLAHPCLASMGKLAQLGKAMPSKVIVWFFCYGEQDYLTRCLVSFLKACFYWQEFLVACLELLARRDTFTILPCGWDYLHLTKQNRSAIQMQTIHHDLHYKKKSANTRPIQCTYARICPLHKYFQLLKKVSQGIKIHVEKNSTNSNSDRVRLYIKIEPILDLPVLIGLRIMLFL